MFSRTHFRSVTIWYTNTALCDAEGAPVTPNLLPRTPSSLNDVGFSARLRMLVIIEQGGGAGEDMWSNQVGCWGIAERFTAWDEI